MYLVYDCELDHERAIAAKGLDLAEQGEEEEEDDNKKVPKRDKSKTNLSKKKKTSKRARFISVINKKKALALESIEDVYGPWVWLDFVRFGCEFALAGLENRLDLAVELLETVVQNRRLYASRSIHTAEMLPLMERSSLLLALQARISRVSFKHIRAFAIRFHLKDSADSDDQVHEGMLGLFGRLLASHTNPDGNSTVIDWAKLSGPNDSTNKMKSSTNGNNDFSTNIAANADGGNQAQLRVADYQKWACRQLCEHVDSWGLIMVTGHCSGLSGRTRFAAAEYERAVAQCPMNPLSYLCLGASQISLAMSRTVQRRHPVVLQGLLALRKYQELRCKNSNNDISQEGGCYLAETWYNVGRAHHQLGVIKYALYCYEQAIELLATSENCQNNLTALAFERPDRLSLLRCCAYNLHLIYNNAGNYAHAAMLLTNYIVIE